MAPSISNESPYLRQNGPIFEIVIKPSSVTIESLNLEKRDVPFIKVRALIDTGASTTAVSQEVIDRLGLTVRGKAKVYTSAKTTEIRDQYVICIEFDTDAYIDTLEVLGANLTDHSIDCLIGRDVLSYRTFIYEGQENNYTLRWGGTHRFLG